MARHVIIVRPRSGNSTTLSSGENCGRKRSLTNSSEAGGKIEMVQKELMCCKVTDLVMGRRYEGHLRTQIGHVEVVPDGSLARCDNRWLLDRWSLAMGSFQTWPHVVSVHVNGVM